MSMRLSIVVLTVTAAATCVVAQTTGKTVEKIQAQHIGVGPVGVESLMGGTIKGQPYSAEVISEFNQVLADGNRINHRTTAFVARDSQGRTRHEARVNVLPAVAVAGDLPKMIMIHDPIAQVTYTLDAKNKIGRKMSVAPVIAGEGKRIVAHGGGDPAGAFEWKTPEAGTVAHGEGPGVAMVRRGAPAGQFTIADGAGTAAVFAMKLDSANMQTESLGSRVIEGVMAEGKRITHTIPAAEIGADRDIQVVNEVWTAQDLKAVIYSKRTDPRSGEMIYRLANVQRAEPPANLFEVPADYKVVEGLPARTIMFRSKDD